MKDQRGIATLMIVVVVAGVLLAGVATFLVLRDNKTSEENVTQDTQPSADSNNFNGSLRTLLGAGQARQCTFDYASVSGSGLATVYTDGEGRSAIKMAITSEDGKISNLSQIYKDNKAYSVFETDEGKVGYVFDLSAAQSTTGSDQTVSADQDFAMNCQGWDVDESVFEIPKDVQFLDTAQ